MHTRIYEACNSSREPKQGCEEEQSNDSNKHVSQVQSDKEPEPTPEHTKDNKDKNEKGAQYGQKFGQNAYAPRNKG